MISIRIVEITYLKPESNLNKHAQWCALSARVKTIPTPSHSLIQISRPIKQSLEKVCQTSVIEDQIGLKANSQ